MLENIMGVFAGTFLGIVTGILPGIHTNSMIVLISGHADSFGEAGVLAVVSMSIANQLASFIPSIFLGIPSENSFLSVLPGQSLARKGFGMHAIRLCIAGALLGVFFSALLAPFSGIVLEKTSDFFSKMAPFALGTVLALMIAGEKTLEKKFFAFIVLCMSAAAGIFLLDSGLVKNNLFLLVTGFFGVPAVVSAFSKSFLPRQKPSEKTFSGTKAAKTGFFGSILASLSSFFPAVSPNEMIFISGEFSGKTSKTKYLLLNGAISTASFVSSFIALFHLGKARTGAAVFVKQFQELSGESLALIIFACIAAAGMAAIATEFIAKKTLQKISKTDYGKLNKIILVFLFALAFFLDGAFGVLVMATASCIGLLGIYSNVKRTHCMAFLIVPTILYYLGA